MSDGLTYTPDSVKVYLNPTVDANGKVAENAEVVAAENYTTSSPDDGCDFHVAFTQAFCDTLKDNDQIVITYSATLNAEAVVVGANTNETKLNWGDASETVWDSTKTDTWSFDVLKYGNGDETKVLKDAKFVLLNSDTKKVAIIVDGKVTGWEGVPAAVDGNITWPVNSEQTTDENGKIVISGLDADTYYLRETVAPAGYNKLADDVLVTINSEGKINVTAEKPDGETKIGVNNQSGTELPETGGIGTTIFYVLGGLLAAGAAVLLVTKKRMSAEK